MQRLKYCQIMALINSTEEEVAMRKLRQSCNSWSRTTRMRKEMTSSVTTTWVAATNEAAPSLGASQARAASPSLPTPNLFIEECFGTWTICVLPDRLSFVFSQWQIKQILMINVVIIFLNRKRFSPKDHLMFPFWRGTTW